MESLLGESFLHVQTRVVADLRMTDNLATLPIWKKDATAYERLSELALLAREHPERFEHFVIVYRQTLSNGNWKIRTMEYEGDLGSRLGLLELGKDELIRESLK